MDLGGKYTDKQVEIIERQILSVYEEAKRDIEAKILDFNRRYKIKESIHLKDVAEGRWTQDQFNKWVQGQVFQGKQWQAKRDQIVETLYKANSTAIKIVNGQKGNVFAFNANYQAYSLEHDAGVNFGFGLYDSATVVNLIKNEPNLLPKPKINKVKDKAWNMRKVTNQITQGIIQGERLDQIAHRIASVTGSQNANSMLTHARTAMTGAQNAGRQQRLKEASEMGIKVKKEWMATLDNRTRWQHADLDGQKQPLNQPFKIGGYTIMYPGDPHARPELVYGCRCTMVGDLEDYPSEYERYDNINGVRIKNMTYRQWESMKMGIVSVDSFQSRLGAAKSVAEINNLMNSQGWWRSEQSGVEEANLTGCDLDSAKSIAASYQQVFEKYPQLIGKFDAPDAQPMGMKEDTYAWCYIRDHGKVQVNPIESKYGNWNNITRSYEKDVISRWHPEGTTAEGIVTHEIGHAIDGLLAREGILGGIAADGSYRYASSSLRNTIMKRAAEKDEAIAEYWNAKDWSGKADKRWQSYAVEKSVSRYAVKNNKEWFAECFAEYITSANPRIVASEFGKELEKLLEKLS